MLSLLLTFNFLIFADSYSNYQNEVQKIKAKQAADEIKNNCQNPNRENFIICTRIQDTSVEEIKKITNIFNQQQANETQKAKESMDELDEKTARAILKIKCTKERKEGKTTNKECDDI